MVSIDELKRVVVFENMTTSMLEKLASIIEVESFGERQTIFNASSAANRFYSVKKGKVLLTTEIAPDVSVSFGAIKPGYSFGWPALFPSSIYNTHAVSVESSDVFVISSEKILDMVQDDHSIGYVFMQKVAEILENRLEYRSAQFLNLLSRHPELASVIK